jgi:hypothetical protein
MVRSRSFKEASARGEELLRQGPVASAARFDRASRRVIVTLREGVQLSFPVAAVQGLRGARADRLARIEISGAGLGLHFPLLDADIYLPGLIAGATGSRAWMAAHMGARGGQARSPAKAAAARANGKRGGRPRKTAALPI